ncbi:MAG: cytochrome C [Acidobacteria bacterium]|nr:MAG: cytochrome C [Acidobacteriota bacterium]
MEVRVERLVGYIVMGLFLVVGVVCYGAFPQEEPEVPVRIMFKSKAGHVLFDHMAHVSESGDGLSCDQCHHEDADDPGRCGECHDAESDVTRADAFHGTCRGCHEDVEEGPVQCSGCHVM